MRRLVELYSSVGETNKAEPLIDQALSDFPNDADMLRFVISYYEEQDQLAKTLEPARRLTLVETSNVQNYLLLARACFVQNKKQEFYKAANQAIRLGGPSLRKAFVADPTFSRGKLIRSSRSWRNRNRWLQTDQAFNWRARTKKVPISVDIVDARYRGPKLVFS